MWGAYAVGSATFVGALRGARATPGSAVVAALPGAAGTALLAAGMGAFEGAAQVTGTQAGPLVTGGVYRYSRNPQYTGIVLVAAAASIATRNLPAAALTGVLATAYRWWVPVEERALAREFGDPYRDYVARTPRWLGPPRD